MSYSSDKCKKKRCLTYDSIAKIARTELITYLYIKL